MIFTYSIQKKKHIHTTNITHMTVYAICVYILYCVRKYCIILRVYTLYILNYIPKKMTQQLTARDSIRAGIRHRNAVKFKVTQHNTIMTRVSTKLSSGLVLSTVTLAGCDCVGWFITTTFEV